MCCVLCTYRFDVFSAKRTNQLDSCTHGERERVCVRDSGRGRGGGGGGGGGGEETEEEVTESKRYTTSPAH